MSAKHTPAKWLKSTRGREFLTFSHATVYRQPFPLGGYVYRTHAHGNYRVALYHGNVEAEAIKAATDAAIVKSAGGAA